MSTIALLPSQAAPAAMPTAAEMFKRLDSAGKGYLTANDLRAAQPQQSASVSISAEGARAASQLLDADSAIQQMDSDGDGQVTGSEFEGALDRAKPQAASAAPAGAPPGGGKGPQGGGGGGGGAGAAPMGSDSSNIYDKADTNQDGTVSDLERHTYEAKHPPSPSDTAVKSYQALAATSGRAASLLLEAA